MPPKNKSKNAPNQHDKRHESGLAPPGKRVTKKHSNGQLNGSPNGKTFPAPALPSTGLNSGFKFPRPPDNLDPAPQTATRDHAVPLEGTERDRVYSDASLEEGGQCDEMGDCNPEPATAAVPSIGVQPPIQKAATSQARQWQARRHLDHPVLLPTARRHLHPHPAAFSPADPGPGDPDAVRFAYLRSSNC